MKKILLFSLLVLACNSNKETMSVQFPYGVKYEVFVMAFADSNADGKGDLKGLTNKLDYFADLGVNGLWLMPIMPSNTYHKYHVVDYKGIDPEYGTLDDFKQLLTEAHNRNIKIITDFIINHTGDDHPWFMEAKKGKDNPYRDYYVWASKDSVAVLEQEEVAGPDTDNVQKWHEVPGDTNGELYYGYFNGQTPDLNFDNPKVRKEIYEAAAFWLKDIGVDGFRLDAAKHIFPTVRAKDNHAFWEEFRTEIQKIKPDAYLVGEVWSDAKTVAPYLKGLPSLFNFDMGYAITEVVQKGNDSLNLVKKYKEIFDYYHSITPDFIDATFIRNHDQPRTLTELGLNIEKVKLAASILMSLPGTPYIYQGEEIGMLGPKTDQDRGQRESFIWDYPGKDSHQSNWYPAVYSTPQTVVPANVQIQDPNSLYHFYKKWIHFRNNQPALNQGVIDYTAVSVKEIISFTRKHKQQNVWVVHNLADVEITLPIPETLQQFSTVVFDTNGGMKQDKTLVVPAYGTLILQ
jgi:alpha-amylase